MSYDLIKGGEMRRGLVAVVCLAFCGTLLAQERWSNEKPGVWAHDKNTITLTQDGAEYTIKHTAKRDWSFYGFPRIAVKVGELFKLSGEVKLESAGESSAIFSVVLRSGEGEVVAWSYGEAHVRKSSSDWQPVARTFLVPVGVSTIEPRLIGTGAAVVKARGLRIERVAENPYLVTPSSRENYRIKGGTLTAKYNGAEGELSVELADTTWVWRSSFIKGGWLVVGVERGAQQLKFNLVQTSTLRQVAAQFSVSSGGELEVAIEAAGAMDAPIDFPPPFETIKGERLIVPLNEGMSYPVDEEHHGLYRLAAYSGHGLCMGFFGAIEDQSGRGWMCIIETPDDGAMRVLKGRDGLLVAGASWDAQKGEFGYTRRARFCFFESGGHVAICKRYRAYAKERGLVKTFREKVKRTPKIDLLMGAANIWNWDAGQRKAEFVAQLQAAGMERILWSGGGSAEQLVTLNQLPHVLTGRYDIYQDIMDPANFERLRHKHGDWVTEAFPHDINWRGPDGDWRRGWRVRAKDGEMLPCAVICDSRALPYARKRIGDELKVKPYTARFIDTTVAAPWFECYHPDHPMTRTQSKEYKMKLLQMVSEEFGLVCGSETGHEASVPYCDYFEGMMSLGPYRVPDSGRNMATVWDEVPPQLAKYQVGERYRLPLWELVYHDCLVAYWYWGDYNNKLPAVWRKRDLFNALYGTPPMYMLTTKQWEEQREEFVASYKRATPVARATGYHEMVDHQILTEDRSVQRTIFANGVEVTVNFGDTPWRDVGGVETAAMGISCKNLERGEQ